MRQLQDPRRQETMKNSKSAQQYKMALEVASRNLKKLVDSGVRIAMGTDTGPPARFQGYFEHMETDLMAKAGLTPTQVLASATADAARCMKLSDRVGTLVAGRFADFLVLDGDPLEDVANLHKINSVWIAGNRIERRGSTTSQ
jgi:imidazolonepropionase-like amidohydrolase